MVCTTDSYDFEDPEVGALRLPCDGYSGPEDLVTLVVHPAVQQYLGLSDEQRAEARRVSEDYRAALRTLYEDFEEREPAVRTARRRARVEASKRDTERRIRQLLSEDQQDRLKRLSWRVRDGEALFDEDVAEALPLTPAQRASLAAAWEQNEADQREMLETLRRIRFKSQEEQQAFEVRYRDAANSRLLAVLTASQRDTFERLKRGMLPLPRRKP